MKCNTIDEVIVTLDQIIDDCASRQDPLGYFAVLYRKVTLRVKKGISQYEFESSSGMERLDVVFANRYFEAYEAYRQQKPCSESWKMAFDAGRDRGTIILQHLLLGINAHINLDLGLAALDAVGAEPLQAIHQDFIDINGVLSELVDDVKKEMGAVSPVFQWLIPLFQKSDEMLINFSIQIARDGAWKFANELSDAGRNQGIIQDRDRVISMLGKDIRKPGNWLRFILRIIALFEWRSVASNLKIIAK